MSYVAIKPEYYLMHQPQGPWHAGAPGWRSAPVPGWGENPNLVGPPRLAVEGLGAYYAAHANEAIHGLGAYYAAHANEAISGCGCAGARAVGADPNAPATFPWTKFVIGAALVAGTVYVFTRPKFLGAVMG